MNILIIVVSMIDAEASALSSIKGQMWIKIYDGDQIIDSTFSIANNLVTGHRELYVNIPKNVVKTFRFSARNVNAGEQLIKTAISYSETPEDCVIPSNGITDKATGKDNCQITTRKFNADGCAKIVVDAEATALSTVKGQVWIKIYDGDQIIDSSFYTANNLVTGHRELYGRIPKNVVKTFRFSAPNMNAGEKVINASITYSGPINAIQSANSTATTNVASFKIEKTVKKVSLTIIPNPVTSGMALIKYYLPEDGIIRLRVTDVYGRSLQSENLGNQKAGDYTYHLNKLGMLSRGTYSILVERNNEIIARELFLLNH